MDRSDSDAASAAAATPGGPPHALVTSEPRGTLTWILPLAALIFAGVLVFQAWSVQGERIVVEAAEGHGIEAGDSLSYRGITVGEIEDVSLEPGLGGVRIDVRLHPSARALAREGSRFWIVRPHLSLEGVQGLETIVGARYLSVLPGPEGGDRRREFVALAEPPIAENVEADGLEILIESPSRFGLAPGAPIHYRGVRVGTLMSVALASDSTSVELSAYVRPPYVPLVRANTLFWETGGLEVDLGWMRGLKVEMDSVRSLLVGGLTMATPPEPGDPVESGHRFGLSLEERAEWLDWRTAIPVGAFTGEIPERLPELLRAQLDWKQGRLFASSKSRIGWLLPIPSGLLGPADLLQPVEDARDDGAVLSFGDERLTLRVEPARERAGLAVLAVELPELGPWPSELLWSDAAQEPPGDCLVVGDPRRAPAALSGARLAADQHGWRIDGGPRFDEGWHGAAVIERESGMLVGILCVGGEGPRIVRPDGGWWW